MATPTGIDTVVRQQEPIAATQATPILMLRIKIHPLARQIVRVQMAGPCIQNTSTFISFTPPTRHNISHIDKRSSLAHYHRMILYPSIHVCYNSGEVIYCVYDSSGSGVVRSCPARTCPRD